MKRSEIKQDESYAYGRYPETYKWFQIKVVDATPIATTPNSYYSRTRVVTEEEKYRGQPLDGVLAVKVDSEDTKPFRAKNRFIRQPWNDYVADQAAQAESARQAALVRRDNERKIRQRRAELRAAWPGNVALPDWLNDSPYNRHEASGRVNIGTLLELIKAVKSWPHT